MVCDLSGAIFDFTVSSRVRLDVSVRIESTQINTVSVRLFAGVAKAVELNLNGCFYYCFASEPNIIK